MKEYYLIHYYDPMDGYSTDPTFYSSEEEARKHVKKDVFAMIECRKYSNEDLLTQIFSAFCNNRNCENCCYYKDCYAENPSDDMKFETKSEQEKLEICAIMARQFEEPRYEDEDE